MKVGAVVAVVDGSVADDHSDRQRPDQDEDEILQVDFLHF